MKYIAIALLMIGAVAAQQHTGRELAESLEKRGEALLDRVKKTLEEVRHAGHGHLAGALEHQSTLVEALVADLKKQLSDKTHQPQMHHIHVIEEDLLHLENQVSEEIRIIENVRHGHVPHGHNQAQLVAKGEELVKKANAELAAHSHQHTREARFIEHEVKAIEELLKAIKAKPTDADLKKDEAQLARHEQTLQRLLERTHHRHPHGPGGH